MKYIVFLKTGLFLPLPRLLAVLIVIAPLFLTGCAHDKGALNLTYTNLGTQGPEQFTLCHDYGCLKQSPVSLSESQWAAVTALFAPTSSSPAAERTQIAKAIAAMETLAGAATGTADDKPRASLLKSESGQLDCVDETLNTARYLYFFKREGLLRWHDLEQPARRGYFVDGAWPHNTAVISDKETGIRYTVDSWFHKNGHEPVIIPLQNWLNGWQPKDGETGANKH